MSRLHWIDLPIAGRLAIMARPRAEDWLDGEIAAWKRAALDILVCLLELDEIVELGLQQEATLCRAAGIEFVPFPIPDRGVPGSLSETLTRARTIATRIAGGWSVAVHCRAGIGRSSMIAACVAVCAGIDTDHAFSLIRDARGLDVPDTREQRDWVFAFEQANRSM